MNRLLLVALAASLSVSAAADAQTIVMRKILTSRLPSTSPDAVGKAEWRITDWRWENPSLTCSDSARQVRNVSCLTKSGTAVDPSRCGAETPEKSQILQRYDGCTTAWKADESWSPFSSSCSDAATRTRTVQCIRSGGDITPRVMDAAACAGAMPAASETRAIYDGCTNEWDLGEGWSQWSSTCSNSATHTRTVQCVRSGGDTKPISIGDAGCSGVKPATSESQPIYSGCTYEWQTNYGAWVGACGETRTRTNTFTCYRAGLSTGKVQVADSFCSQAKPSNTETGDPIPCVNLVYDGGWETIGGTWSPAGRYSGNAHGGMYYGEAGPDRYASQMVYNLVVGKKYTFSIWTKSRAGSCGSSVVQVQHGYPRSVPFSCTTSWVKSSLSFTATMTLANIVIGNGQVQFDDVSLVEG